MSSGQFRLPERPCRERKEKGRRTCPAACLRWLRHSRRLSFPARRSFFSWVFRRLGQTSAAYAAPHIRWKRLIVRVHVAHRHSALLLVLDSGARRDICVSGIRILVVLCQCHPAFAFKDLCLNHCVAGGNKEKERDTQRRASLYRDVPGFRDQLPYALQSPSLRSTGAINHARTATVKKARANECTEDKAISKKQNTTHIPLKSRTASFLRKRRRASDAMYVLSTRDPGHCCPFLRMER